MFYSTRSKLIASFLGVCLLVGAVSLLVGVQLLYKAVLSEATNRVRLDLNTAREIYQTRMKTIRIPLSTTVLGPGFRLALENKEIPDLVSRLERLARNAELDFAGIVTKEGTTLCKIGKGSAANKSLEVANPIAQYVVERRVPVSGTLILSNEFLRAEDPELAERANVRFIPTPRAAPRDEKEETSGMALAAGIPIFENDEFLGVIYGGALLTRSTDIVDTVRDTAFRNETYKGRSIGTATIFFNDLRISTNVITPEGKRAIGTRVSKEVKERVLTDGKRWTDRAFVVSDWYITAYEPIEDIFGERVGMLYVGVLEAKYVDMRRKALSILVIITVAGMILAIGLGYILADKIMNPVHRLIKASQQVSEGDLTPDIGTVSKDEIGVLQKTFLDMVAAMGRRTAAAENQILQSEKQASVGRLAAGVAHEINNPLTGVLTYTHMLLRRRDIPDDIRADLEVIADSTERVRAIVKGLLEFSRQTKLTPEPTQVNHLISSTISLVENQALVKGVSIKFNPGENLPMVVLDRGQFQSVLLNMIINALDATEPGDNINIYTATGLSASDSGRKGVEITIADTGSGIPPDNLDKLFDPFFTTKEVGKGTGLGLSVSLGIVQRHGGTIRVQSEVGKGTRFFVWLPIEGGVQGLEESLE
ncbi:MAG TPA: cache domain-containing protein [Desulfatiglandales bacterium]|nr:cache domain-containing protein [Desulfatiglandales bacterium]